MRFLVFDTETTGLPLCKIVSQNTLESWPHIIQFSYVIYDTNYNDIVETLNEIVKLSDGIHIPEESIKIHGITNDICKKKGIKNIKNLLHTFFNCLKNIDVLVSHNILFDENMVKAELLRLKNTNNLSLEDYNYKLNLLTNKNKYCTLMRTINLCKITKINKSGKEYNKFPKLIELHKKLFETEPNNLHNSFNDVLVTLRCFIKLNYDIDLNDNSNKYKIFKRYFDESNISEESIKEPIKEPMKEPMKEPLKESDIMYQDELVCILRPEVKKGIIVWTHYTQPPNMDSLCKLGLKTGQQLQKEGIDFGRNIFHSCIFFRAPYYLTDIDYSNPQTEILSSYGANQLGRESRIYIRVDPDKTYVFSSEIRSVWLCSGAEKFIHKSKKTLTNYLKIITDNINIKKNVPCNKIICYDLFTSEAKLFNKNYTMPKQYSLCPIEINSEILVSIPHLTQEHFVII